MTNSQRLSAVRQQLQTWFTAQSSTQPWEIRESILIREGFYCGRRFDFAGYRAVWFVEEDQVKIYGPDGALAEAFQASATPVATSPVATSAASIAIAAGTAAEDQPPLRRAA